MTTYKDFIDNPELINTVDGKVELVCDICKNTFIRGRNEIRKIFKYIYKNPHTFCSRECFIDFKNKHVVKDKCATCGAEVRRKLYETAKSKSGNFFCSRSCSATFQNTHKTIGARRSKLEVWLEEQLRNIYPNLAILFNNKEAINSELDIYFPELSLAFELNGIYHYEPIHGPEKLASIQNNDTRKFQACLENNIELCIIDSSSMKNFKISKANFYLSIIQDIVNNKII